MTDIPLIIWILSGIWLSFFVLMGFVAYKKIKISGPIRRRRCFKLIKGDNVE